MFEKKDNKEDEKKSLFEKIGDAFSSRDEKEAEEAAKKAVAEADSCQEKGIDARIAAAKAKLEKKRQ